MSGEPPRAGWWLIAPLMALSGAALTWPASGRPWAWLLGRPGGPELAQAANLHWLVHARGLLGATHTRLLMYPAPVDRVVEQGFPLDALLSSPLISLLGWPAGFTLLQIAAVVACGLGAAWMAWRWWRCEAAAVAAGVAYQCSPPVLEAMADGSPELLLGAAAFPVAAALLDEAAAAPSALRGGLAAGVMAGLGCLLWWSWAPLGALGLAAVLVAATSRRRALAAGGWCLVGAAAVVAVPGLYILHSLSEYPARAALTLGEVIEYHGLQLELAALLDGRDLGTLPLVRLLAPTLGLAALGRSRRVIAPGLWVVLGLALAAGPTLAGTGVPGPFAALLALPAGDLGLTPHRAALLAAAGAAAFAGGGAARLARWARRELRTSWLRKRGLRGLPALASGAAIGLALLLEVVLLDPRVPAAVTPGGPSERAQELAGGQGPALVLPAPTGEPGPAELTLLDQPHHGRPLAGGWAPPTDAQAPIPFRDTARRTPLGFLFKCGAGNLRYTGDADEARRILAGLGLDAVYVDREAGGDYAGCAQSLLGEPTSQTAHYLVYSLIYNTASLE